MEMILIYAVVGFILLMLLKALAAKTGSNESKNSLGYRQKKTLFTPAERSFLGVLDQCINKESHRIFGKVRVADLIEPNPSKNRSEWQRAFNAISAKHFDFVVCSADTLQPVCAIELDDSSHSQKKRQQRDELLERSCKDADLPLIRVPAKRSYKREEVKVMLANHIECLAGGERFSSKTVAPPSAQEVASQLQGQITVNPAQKPGALNTADIDVPVDGIGGAVR